MITHSSSAPSPFDSAPKLPSLEVEKSELSLLSRLALRALGYTEQEASLMTEVLLYAESRGNSQGIIKLTSGGMNRTPSCEPPLVIPHATIPWAATIRGRWSHGMLTTDLAATHAADLAKKFGIGMVAVTESNTSSGALGYFTSKIAARDFIGFAAAGTPAKVAPLGAREAFFGTNPLSLSMPRKDAAPLVLDLATSTISWFEVLSHAATGSPLPPGTALDASGAETRDAQQALKGALIPFGSHKGSGLAFMLELLTGVFVGAESNQRGRTKENWGSLCVALRPDLFVDAAEFFQRLEIFLKDYSFLEKRSAEASLFTPGERGNIKAQEKSSICIERETWCKLRTIAGIDS